MTTPFFEALWQGESIGDGADSTEALAAYAAVRSEEDDWESLCAADGADPHLLRYAHFDAYLDNADALERIEVSATMIREALADLP